MNKYYYEAQDRVEQICENCINYKSFSIIERADLSKIFGISSFYGFCSEKQTLNEFPIFLTGAETQNFIEELTGDSYCFEPSDGAIQEQIDWLQDQDDRRNGYGY